jgi:GNAT superfamily N-acetyltransferase
VREETRGDGLAARLLTNFEDEARARGCTHVEKHMDELPAHPLQLEPLSTIPAVGEVRVALCPFKRPDGLCCDR